MEQRDVFVQQSPFSPAQKVLCIVVAVLCLLPTLTFPISHDHAIFYLGGKAILQGKLLYRDFVDVKPPLIYNIFAFIQVTLGNSEFAMRFFDVVWQVLTLASLRFFVQWWTRSERIAYSSLVVYALLYTISNYSSTLQCETLAVLPMLWLFYLYQQRRNTLSSWFTIGLLYACIVHLKYTLGIIIFPLVLFDIFRYKPRVGMFFAQYAVFFAGFTAVTALLYYPFFQAPHGIEHYLAVLAYTGQYAAQHSQFVVTASAQSLLLYYADKFSLVFSLAALTAVVVLYRNRNNLQDAQRDMFFFLVVQYAFLLVSILVEQKFIPYHFSRLYGIVAPLVTLGLYAFWRTLHSAWLASSLLRRTAMGIGIAVLLLATPLPRFARILYGACLYAVSPQGYTAMYTKEDPKESVIILNDQKEVVEFVQSHMRTNESVAVISVAAPCVYYYLQTSTAPALPGSQFYFPAACPPAWRELFAEQLRTSNWVIVQTNDVHPLLMMGLTQTSPDLLARDTLYAPIFKGRYREVRRFPKFIVYRAIAP